MQKLINIFIFLAILCVSLYSKDHKCNKPINLQASMNSTIFDLVDILHLKCGFSVVIMDEDVKTTLNQSAWGINAINLTLEDILNLLLLQRDLYYEIDKSILKIYSKQTKIFKIDYITSIREGQAVIRSSVDVLPEALGSRQNQNDSKISNDNIIKVSEKFEFWNEIGSDIYGILGEDKKSNSVVINSSAGLVYVTAKPSKISKVKEYIDTLNSRLNRQVAIDVAIISVEFEDEYSRGIDWSKFELSFDSYINNTPSSISWQNRSSGFFDGFNKSLKIGANLHFNLNGLINFLNTVGKVQIVSNPKITTLNNQQALISVGDNINYRIAETTDYENSASNKQTTTFKQYSLFVGILLNITAQVSDDNKIMLRINPSLSSIKDNLKQNEGIREIAPDTIQKKLSTVVQVNDSDTIILGGLIGSTQISTNTKVPILGDIPIIKHIFSSNGIHNKKVELIFVITPKIQNK